MREERYRAYSVRHDIVPAQPGWFVLNPWAGDEPQDTGWSREPVLAWRIETGKTADEKDFYSMAYPICAIGVGISETGADILLRPDGKVYFVEDRDFDNEAEALEAYRADLIERRRQHEEMQTM